MAQKYNIGDFVKVSFMGQIKEISLFDNELVYYIEDNYTSARRVKESQVYPLPQPEDFEKEKS